MVTSRASRLRGSHGRPRTTMVLMYEHPSCQLLGSSCPPGLDMPLLSGLWGRASSRALVLGAPSHQGEPSSGSSAPKSRSTLHRVGWCWLCHGLCHRGSMGHWWAPEPTCDIPPPRRLWCSSAYSDPMGHGSMSQSLCFSSLACPRRCWQPAATAGHPDGQQGWRCEQPVSPTLGPEEGPSVGSRAQQMGLCMGVGSLWGQVVCWNHASLTKRAAGEIQKRAVLGLSLTPWSTASILRALCPGLSRLLPFTPYHEHKLCHLSPQLTPALCCPQHLQTSTLNTTKQTVMLVLVQPPSSSLG